MRQGLSVVLCTLLAGAQARGQQAPAGSPSTWQGEPGVRPDPKRAQKAAGLGDKAAAEGKFDDALAYYAEAARFAPQDMAIVGRGAALRSKLVREHVEAAERDALTGEMEKATEELGAALRIDPGDAIVRERLAQMQSMEEKPAAQADSEIPGLPQLKPDQGNHSFNLRGDTKTVYEQVAQQFGVKTAFDPDLAPKSVRLKVDEVDFYTAMSILGTLTATFWRPVDAVEKRLQPRAGGLGRAVDHEVGPEILAIFERPDFRAFLDEEIERIVDRHVRDDVDLDLQFVDEFREDIARQAVAVRVLLDVHEMLGGRDFQRMRDHAGAAVRRGSKPDDLRAQRDRPVVSIVRQVVDGGLNGHRGAGRVS